MHSRRDRRLSGKRVEVLEAPIPRRHQARVNRQRLGHWSRALRHPYREHERQTGPALPLRAEVVGVAVLGEILFRGVELGIADARPEAKRGVADHETSIML